MQTNEQLEPEAPETAQPEQAEAPAEETVVETEEAMDEGVTMESLLAGEELSLDLPKAGQVRSGVVVSASENEALISIGAKSEGIIPGREMSQLSDEDREKLTVGSEVRVYVQNPEDSQGNLVLSFMRAQEESDWISAAELMESNEIFHGTITGYNKGGLIVEYGRLRGFIPSSQVSPSRRAAAGGGTPDQRWGKMVGEEVIARAIEVDRERRRLIFSELAALQEAREIYKERLLKEIEIGDDLEGRVTSLAQFGAFVNINGADGLVHLTEVSWERIKHPNEVLKVGQEVNVKVISIDRAQKRIGLSIRQLQADPWPEKVAKFRDGQLVEGLIVRLAKFGAFARIADGLEGLIHISELSDRRVEHPKEVLTEGETVTLRIINIDVAQHRIGLSLRKVHSAAYADLDMRMAMEAMMPEEEAEEEVEEAAVEAPEAEVEEAPEAVAEEAAVEEETAEEEAPAEEPAAEPAAEEEETPAAEETEEEAEEEAEEAAA